MWKGLGWIGWEWEGQATVVVTESDLRAHLNNIEIRSAKLACESLTFEVSNKLVLHAT